MLRPYHSGRNGHSCRNSLAVGSLPAPGARAIAAPRYALLVDLRNHLAIAGKQRFGRAHLGTYRQLAFGKPVGAVFLILRFAPIRLRPASAIGALIHFAA